MLAARRSDAAREAAAVARECLRHVRLTQPRVAGAPALVDVGDEQVDGLGASQAGRAEQVQHVRSRLPTLVARADASASSSPRIIRTSGPSRSRRPAPGTVVLVAEILPGRPLAFRPAADPSHQRQPDSAPDRGGLVESVRPPVHHACPGNRRRCPFGRNEAVNCPSRSVRECPLSVGPAAVREWSVLGCARRRTPANVSGRSGVGIESGWRTISVTVGVRAGARPYLGARARAGARRQDR